MHNVDKNGHLNKEDCALLPEILSLYFFGQRRMRRYPQTIRNFISPKMQLYVSQTCKVVEILYFTFFPAHLFLCSLDHMGKTKVKISAT